MRGASNDESPLRILAVTQGLWGERIAGNIENHAPPDWSLKTWGAPRVIPPIVDDPEDFLPTEFPESDLVLALGEVAGLAQLLPDIVRMAGAKAIIAPIDRNESLPAGLMRQLQGWLKDLDVAVAFPKPFCSLTETSFNRTPLVTPTESHLIQRFARYFGKPEFKVTVEEGKIIETEVIRDSACGCAQHVAKNLIGEPVDSAIEKAGMLHHHFPCLASMNKDTDYNDTLMHVSGNILRDAIKDQIRSHLTTVYLRPDGYTESEEN